jgi:hypothetical protein
MIKGNMQLFWGHAVTFTLYRKGPMFRIYVHEEPDGLST